jgi:hypothetical protein
MATWDASDLLVRVKLYAARPASDETMSDGAWYATMTEAEREWVGIMAAQFPNLMMGAPEKMSSTDSGATYYFSASATPLAVQIFDGLNGNLMLPGTNWDDSSRYIWEGNRIRFPRGQTRTFGDGPYARYVKQPTVALSATATMTLAPDYARILVIYRTLSKWASMGDLRNAEVWDRREALAWTGNPNTPGDVGILGTLKMSNPFAGTAAHSGSEGVWGLDYLHGLAGQGYSPI